MARITLAPPPSPPPSFSLSLWRGVSHSQATASSTSSTCSHTSTRSLSLSWPFPFRPTTTIGTALVYNSYSSDVTHSLYSPSECLSYGLKYSSWLWRRWWWVMIATLFLLLLLFFASLPPRSSLLFHQFRFCHFQTQPCNSSLSNTFTRVFIFSLVLRFFSRKL